MENKETVVKELSKYEKNFQYMTESGLLYPNIDLKSRKRLIQLYNQLFDQKDRISMTCRNCLKKQVRALAKWYDSNKDAIQDSGAVQMENSGHVDPMILNPVSTVPKETIYVQMPTRPAVPLTEDMPSRGNLSKKGRKTKSEQ